MTFGASGLGVSGHFLIASFNELLMFASAPGDFHEPLAAVSPASGDFFVASRGCADSPFAQQWGNNKSATTANIYIYIYIYIHVYIYIYFYYLLYMFINISILSNKYD